MLDELLDGNLVLEEDWQGLESATRKEVLCSPDERTFLDRLVGHGLLNNYQACRIEAGTTFGMILGNYRVLDRIGAGGMGVVFKAEHIRLRRQVAIKVLPMDPQQLNAKSEHAGNASGHPLLAVVSARAMQTLPQA